MGRAAAIGGGGMGNWGLPSSHPGDEEGMESYPSAQATASHRVEGLGWESQCKVP